jgi:hypothetical protein
MHIPDQFWKHFQFTITTSDDDIKRRMLEDEDFWYEPMVLTRDVDGAQFVVNEEGDGPIVAIDAAKRLRVEGEVAFRLL